MATPGRTGRAGGRTHVLKEEVDVLVVIGLHDVKKSNNVLVVSELLQEDDLAEGALGVRGVLKGAEDLLQGEDLVCLLVLNLPDNAVGLNIYA